MTIRLRGPLARPVMALAIAASALICALQDAAAAPSLDSVHIFCTTAGCPDGNLPLGGLLRDSDGNLYGTTFSGGLSATAGIVFELKPVGARFRYRILHKFCSRLNGSRFCRDGAQPSQRLISDVLGNLYGVTNSGGTHNAGTVFMLRPNFDRSHFQLVTIYNFCVPSCGHGFIPNSGLSYAGQETGAPYDGTSPLFGTTSDGGTTGFGVAYELTAVPGTPKRKQSVLYSFCQQTDCADGRIPVSLVPRADGTLIGTTQLGANGGVAFELSPNGAQFSETVLYSFCSAANCTDGKFPIGSLTLGAKGDLFGETQQGGAFNSGTVFKLVPKGVHSKETVLYSFCGQTNCVDGAFPSGGLTFNSAGDMFGTTVEGGAAGFATGTVFELIAGTHQHEVLYNFCTLANCADGQQPGAGVILDESGNLFGTTSEGGTADSSGTVFRLTP